MSQRATRLAEALAAQDDEALVAAVPYACYLGLAITRDAEGARYYCMPCRADLIGNPHLPALHGGTVASLMTLAMQFEALIDLPAPRLPDPVDFTIDYWRSARDIACTVSARLVRSGRHVAQAQAECWQSERDRPIAFARAAFVLRDV